MIQRAIVVFNLCMLTLGAFFGVGLVYRVLAMQVQPDVLATESRETRTAGKNSAAQPLSHYEPILARDLFKTLKIPQALPDTQALNLENLEQTQLKLKLWGTVSGAEETAYAVIEDTQQREQDLYRTGDTIQNATIKMILRAKVVLNVNGKDEVLAMEETQALKGSGPGPVARAMPIPQFHREPTDMEQRISLRREMINEAMQDVSKLATEIAIVPHMENGQPSGLALTNIKPNSIFRQMGLRNGDILMGVDGSEIRTVEDALRLYESLKQAPNVNVQLKRRGEERVINYNIR
jgi:general secretion pathway protein C